MNKLQQMIAEARKGGFNLKEYLTRSEAPGLFTQAINDMLIRAAQPELPDVWNQLYTTIRLDGRRDINFPSIRGVNPDLVPELGEFAFVDQALTSITVEPRKFGMRFGVSNEMIADNEVGYLGYIATERGRAHRELRRREAMKAISFFSTGGVTSTGAIGIRNHGFFYPQGGYTNIVSGSSQSWEQMIGRASVLLKNQTVTVADMTIQFPVTPNFILANPTWEMSIKKVLNAGITVVGVGIGPGPGMSGTNVAGTNVFGGMLSIQVYDPTIPTAVAFIGQAGRGLVFIEREPLQLDDNQNFGFDATEMRTKERFLPAVVEERFICELALSGF